MEFFTNNWFLLIGLGLILGFVISKFLEKSSINNSIDNARKEADNI